MERDEYKKCVISALTDAQKIAFAPLTFQAVSAMLELGLLKQIDSRPECIYVLKEELNLSEYTVSTLLEVAEASGIVNSNDGIYSITPLGQAFLYDEMTRVNFNFVKDVCYKGAEKLTESFITGEPKGLKAMFGDAATIYPYLSKLPQDMKNSWFEFDHYYSDNCFDIVYKIITPVSQIFDIGANTGKYLADRSYNFIYNIKTIITPVSQIFDIGANTGKFEKVCRKYNKDINLTLIDLPQNIEVIRNDPELAGCKFHAANILEEADNLPEISGAVVMSQFLDCFSPQQIKFILEKVAKTALDDTKIYILEPFIDRQKFEGAKLSLVHTSLYFTCMANGCSKMYSFSEMETIIKDAGLKVNAVYDALGAHDYTLLECVKNV